MTCLPLLLLLLLPQAVLPPSSLLLVLLFLLLLPLGFDVVLDAFLGIAWPANHVDSPIQTSAFLH